MTDQYVLRLRGTHQEFELSGPSITIGRGDSSDIVLSSSDVSKNHALITQHDGKFFIEDSNSTNGTVLNQWRVTSPEVLAHGDAITIANFTLDVVDVSESEERTTFSARPDLVSHEKENGMESVDSIFLVHGKSVPEGVIDGFGGAVAVLVETGRKVAERRESQRRQGERRSMRGGDINVARDSRSDSDRRASDRRGRTVIYHLEPNRDSEWIIGRHRDCDICIDDAQISREHAVIFRKGEQWVLEDQHSRNGTFVNGLEVSMTYLMGGETISVGSVDLTFKPLG